MYDDPLNSRIIVHCEEADARWRVFGVDTWDRLMWQIRADKLVRVGDTRRSRLRSYYVGDGLVIIDVRCGADDTSWALEYVHTWEDLCTLINQERELRRYRGVTGGGRYMFTITVRTNA